uniref:Uncharacterized protein n=1 Tax=Rhizophora mucronata TaxID=61149 RepID=A0A2P2M4I9_RHIMU
MIGSVKTFPEILSVVQTFCLFFQRFFSATKENDWIS